MLLHTFYLFRIILLFLGNLKIDFNFEGKVINFSNQYYNKSSLIKQAHFVSITGEPQNLLTI